MQCQPIVKVNLARHTSKLAAKHQRLLERCKQSTKGDDKTIAKVRDRCIQVYVCIACCTLLNKASLSHYSLLLSYVIHIEGEKVDLIFETTLSLSLTLSVLET